MSIWLSQWLCSARHAAFAIPWDPEETTAAAIAVVGEDMRIKMGLGDHCGICGQPIAPEAHPTRFTSMQQAIPALEAVQQQQLVTRLTLDNLGLTVERWGESWTS